MNRLMIVCITLMSAASNARCSTPLVVSPPAEIRAIRSDEQITIDGILSEPIWRRDAGTTAFVQAEPSEGILPTEKTVVHIAFDDAAMYIGARMYDNAPDSLVVRLSRRDAAWDSDMFFLYIDPYHDRRTGLYFGLDAAGTFYDGTLTNDDWDQNTWDGVWEGKVTIDREGWVAEMRIPFSQLRFQQQEQYTWGVNFRRQIARKNERDYIVFTPKGGSGFVSRFVTLTGIEHITASRQVELLPYITTQAAYTQHAPHDPFNDGSKYTPRIGADLKVGISSNLTLDATVNPDFGQVEVDPAVVNLSDAETFFNEKRPFFIEGSNIFSDFGIGGPNNSWNFNWGGATFLYSRRIGRAPQGRIPDADFTDVPLGTKILGAGKLTGKVGDSWNVGTIHAVTNREYADLATGGQRTNSEVEPFTYYGIARAQKEFNAGRQALGFISMATVRKFDDDRLRAQINSNGFVDGLDGWAFLDSEKVWIVSGWTAGSYVAGNRARITAIQNDSRHYFQRPDAGYLGVDTNATSLAGYGFRLRLNKQKGNFFTNAAFGMISPGMEINDLGFMSRTDIINGHFVESYRWNDPASFHRFLELGAAAFVNYDYGWNRTWEGYMHFGSVQFHNFYSVDWSLVYNPPSYNNRRTRGGPLTRNGAGYEINLSASSDQNQAIVVSSGGSTYQAEWDRDWNIYSTITWRPSSNISIGLSPTLSHTGTPTQYIGTFADPSATATYGNRYVFAALNQTELSAGIRVNWTFTPKLSFQMYIQPLISAGEYYDMKELAALKTYAFNVYGQSGNSTYDPVTHIADPDGDGPAQPINVGNPNFNFKSVRGNAILRWEYLPGSTLYFVWTQSRNDVEETGEFRFNSAIRRLMDASPDNIFMVKMSYWWSL